MQRDSRLVSPSFSRAELQSPENIDLEDEPVSKPLLSSQIFTKPLDVKNSLGFQDYPDIYDQRGHLMQFKFMSVTELNCNLCLDDIDTPLGYF
jgi:hypothetical protein